jgi:hypothetical protein
MMPKFIKSVARQVRQLVDAGKAVHATLETAEELDLLACLPWAQARTPDHRQNHALDAVAYAVGKEDPLKPRAVTPADIALGWLLASKAVVADRPDGDLSVLDCALPTDVERAAVCAELAVLAARLEPVVMPIVTEVSEETKKAFQNMLAAFGSGDAKLMPMPVDVQPVGIDPHDGTREGARACWAFIIGTLEAHRPRVVSPMLKGGEAPCPFPLLETYRRELEAMR